VIAAGISRVKNHPGVRVPAACPMGCPDWLAQPDDLAHGGDDEAVPLGRPVLVDHSGPVVLWPMRPIFSRRLAPVTADRPRVILDTP
jgi:hypothetical protein